MVSSVNEMMTIDMSSNQILRAGYQNINGTNETRLCLSILIAGLFASAFITNKRKAPLIIDMIPLMNRIKGTPDEDFCKKNGRISIKDGEPLIKERARYILKNHNKIFSEGDEVWKVWLKSIQEDKHIVMTLEDAHLKRIDPEFGINREKEGCGFLFKAMLIRHSETKRTIALYHCAQIASTIGGVS